MDIDTATKQASETPQDAWAGWQREHSEVMARVTGPQRILLEAAVKFVAVIAAQPVLLRPSLTSFGALERLAPLNPRGFDVARVQKHRHTTWAHGVAAGAMPRLEARHVPARDEAPQR
jgi:hypothetical protein